MSIKIVPQEQLTQQEQKANIIHKIPLLFYPAPKILYANRLKRLEQLAKESPFKGYLNFCSKIVSAQQNIVESMPVIQDLSKQVKDAAENNLAPLSLENYPLNHQWIDYIKPIMDAVNDINEQISLTITHLSQNSKQQLHTKAINLLTGKFELVDNNESVFIWSALSLYYSQLASQLPGKAIAQFGEQRFLCPVCQSSPTASMIHIGNHLGLRYLHCSLCESEWYVPRAKCTSCDNLENITYFSLDKELSAIKTECCESCHGYLKIFNQDQDPALDIIADDINSLVLDMETEQQGFAKSGLNPFLFSK